MHRSPLAAGWAAGCLVFALAARGAAPDWLDDRFELPPGFRIYRAAGPALSGGSYALAFDGEGRLLVGDGTALRRLVDDDGDGIFDRFETLATGLGPRGPQGILVWGDEVFAVGGDGVQRFSGYQSGGPLTARGRMGAALRTGGDHDAHTLLRGQDGWIYLMAGNGSGLSGRAHITEKTSPALFEREASVFRISRDGTRWECVASGGRNPPGLGQNYLGELFSFDSDMEWHVGLPWYRPVRLNHWAVGSDQGWHEVGALPPYFVDNTPGILNVGRGSPTWGLFYEHQSWPAKYHDAFLCGDYRWKRESDDQYATTGRLVAFFLRRQGAGWTATMEQVAKPRPGARDADGRLINFALVDVAVAPDGSVFLSDHNQGIWRLCHGAVPGAAMAPAIVPPWPDAPSQPAAVLQALLTLPQPASERTRLREEALRTQLGPDADRALQRAATESKRPLPERLRAIRFLAPNFGALSSTFLGKLAADRSEEIRGQAAWLLGLRGGDEARRLLVRLLNDPSPFARRRAAEALARDATPDASVAAALIDHLDDPERLVRYLAMNALAHRPSVEWLDRAAARPSTQARVRALAASVIRREPADPASARKILASLLAERVRSKEDHLDILRVLTLFQTLIEADAALRDQTQAYLLRGFPDPDRDIRWEQARLLGDFRVNAAFGRLLQELEREPDRVTQFHLARSLFSLPAGWSPEEEQRALAWVLRAQRGWFAEFGGKGVEFPEFWATVLATLGTHHREELLQAADRVDLSGLLGNVLLGALVQTPAGDTSLIEAYARHPDPVVRLRILKALQPLHTPLIAEFLSAQHEQIDADTESGAALQGAILQHWASRPDETTLPYLVYEGLFHSNPQVVRDVVAGLIRQPDALRKFLHAGVAPAAKPTPGGDADLAADLINRMIERAELFAALENILAAWSGQTRPGFQPAANLQRKPDPATRATALAYWQEWYGRQFRKPFQAGAGGATEKSDAELHRFLLGEEARGGDARRGAVVYEKLQCQSCHGGGAAPGNTGRLFGPDLAGVTRRLTRQELADALVYPSKQVADRFKAVEVTLKDGTVLTGFVTEQSTEAVTLAERDQVRPIARANIQSLSPLATSLMPERLLARADWSDLRDLLAFLEEGTTPGQGALASPVKKDGAR